MASLAPVGGLEEYTLDDLSVNARLALERSRELLSDGDKKGAESWGARWNELIEETDRRKVAIVRAKAPGRGKPREKAHRIYWPYAPVPIAIIDDLALSPVAKVAAAIIARSINMGPWNVDLHEDMGYPELAERLGVSRWTAMRAIEDLRAGGYLEVSSLGRGGCRFRFPISSTHATDQ